jgi:hypothetical protein
MATAPVERHAIPTQPGRIPTAEEEALQAPGEGEGILTQLTDPGVLLNPENLAAGAATGGKMAYEAGKSIIGGAISGAGQAAAGLASLVPAAKGFVQGVAKGLKGEPDITLPEVKVTAKPPSVADEVEDFTFKPTTEGLPVDPMRPQSLGSAAGIPKYAGSVNLNRINTDDDVKFAIKEASEQIPKREPIALETIETEATKMGFSLEDSEKFATLTQQQRAKFLATRNVHTALAERYETVRKAYVADQTDTNFQTLKQAEAEFLRGFKASQQVASEAGLALRTFGMQSNPADMKSQGEKAINQMLTLLQSKNKLGDEITQRLATLDKDNPEQMGAFIKELSTRTAPWKDKLYEAYLNSILSGPGTHVANIAGSLTSLSMRPFDRVGSATVDILSAPLRGGQRERFFSEGLADVWGMASALPDASRAFLKSAANGFVSYGSKVDAQNRGESIGGMTGEIVRVPTKLLQATDEFFKALSRGGSRRVVALREAAEEGLTGQARLDAIAEKVRNPSPELLEKVEKEALRATFQQEPGKWTAAILRAREAIEPFKYIAPFIKTPVNIGKEGLMRTPLGWIEHARELGMGKLPKGGELSDELQRTLVGTGLAAWVATEVVAGNITGGGPADPEQKRALYETGWRPYAIKIGDTYYPYNRIEPLATMLGTVADATELADVMEEGDEKQILPKLSQGFAKTIMDKTMLQGMSEMSDALHDPGRYGEKFIASRLSAVVPSALSQVARAQDDELRQVSGILDGLRNRVPAMGPIEGRQGLNPKRTLYGDPVEQSGNFWSRLLSPSVPSEEQGTPGQIAIAESQVDIGRLPDSITFANTKIKLDPDQYDRFQVVTGHHVRAMVESIASSGGFRTMTKEQQQDMLKKAVEKGRDVGRKQFIAELRPTVSPKK